jgi:hypothetical protein
MHLLFFFLLSPYARYLSLLLFFKKECVLVLVPAAGGRRLGVRGKWSPCRAPLRPVFARRPLARRPRRTAAARAEALPGAQQRLSCQRALLLLLRLHITLILFVPHILIYIHMHTYIIQCITYCYTCQDCLQGDGAHKHCAACAQQRFCLLPLRHAVH